MKDFMALILAGGQGVRMKSDLPKVLHSICGRPMIDYVIEATAKNKPKKTFVVVGMHNKLALASYFSATKKKSAKFIVQKNPLGTADAVKAAKAKLKGSRGNVLVVCADVPLIREETLKNLMERHIQSDASCTLMTVFLQDPFGLGRIIRDEFSKVKEIVEENDASEFQKRIKEINSGIYCFKIKDLLLSIDRVEKNAKKKEYYLTDIIEIMYEDKKRIETLSCEDSYECLGINSQWDLANANMTMQKRIIRDFFDRGVSVVDPKTTFIDYGVQIQQGTKIYPFTVIESGVKVGKNCSIGPFCHLRPGTVINDNICIGNFTEVVRSSIGSDTLCKHFSYLGDTTVGKKVNIGAGSVIANFDGEKKNTTVIKDGALIGCDTILIAPSKIGKNVVTGAGAVVTKKSNIKDGSIVVGVPARSLEQPQKKSKRKSKKR